MVLVDLRGRGVHLAGVQSIAGLGRLVPLQELLVGNDPDVAGWEAHGTGVGHTPWNFFDCAHLFFVLVSFGQARKWDLYPDHVFTRDQHADGPVGGPGVEKNRLAAFITGNRVGNQGRVIALNVINSAAQRIHIKMMLNYDYRVAGINQTLQYAQQSCYILEG